VILDEAANRLHAQKKSILVVVLARNAACLIPVSA